MTGNQFPESESMRPQAVLGSLKRCKTNLQGLIGLTPFLHWFRDASLVQCSYYKPVPTGILHGGTVCNIYYRDVSTSSKKNKKKKKKTDKIEKCGNVCISI